MHLSSISTVCLDSKPEKYMFHYSTELCFGKSSYSFKYTVFGRSLHFPNEQDSAHLLFRRRIRRALAAEMLSFLRQTDPDALLGRTVHGLAFELLIHYLIYRLIPHGRIGMIVEVTDAGSLYPDCPGYDTNAWFFEGPAGLFRRIFRTPAAKNANRKDL